jgi:hypothetical protein
LTNSIANPLQDLDIVLYSIILLQLSYQWRSSWRQQRKQQLTATARAAEGKGGFFLSVWEWAFREKKYKKLKIEKYFRWFSKFTPILTIRVRFTVFLLIILIFSTKYFTFSNLA